MLCGRPDCPQVYIRVSRKANQPDFGPASAPSTGPGLARNEAFTGFLIWSQQTVCYFAVVFGVCDGVVSLKFLPSPQSSPLKGEEGSNGEEEEKTVVDHNEHYS